MKPYRSLPWSDAWRLVEEILAAHFPQHNRGFLAAMFAQVQRLFAGKYPGYQGCDTPFHDAAHTCAATEAVGRILDGHIKSKAKPLLTSRDFELTVAAILLHDVGFFKRRGDRTGTGAKYTLIHVERSSEFAAGFLPPLGVRAQTRRMVQRLIRCTASGADFVQLRFHNPRERFLGCVVGTGDLLGQMAAPSYPRQLPFLYREFREAAAYSHLRGTGIGQYKSAEDLMRKTRGFYENYAKPMLDVHWGGAYHALNHHFEDGHNWYLEAIESNLDRIDRLLASRRPRRKSPAR